MEFQQCCFTIDAAKDRKVAASDADSALLIAAGAEIIDKPTVRDKNLITATSGDEVDEADSYKNYQLKKLKIIRDLF